MLYRVCVWEQLQLEASTWRNVSCMQKVWKENYTYRTLVLRNEFLVAFEQLETSQKQPEGFKDAFIHEVWGFKIDTSVTKANKSTTRYTFAHNWITHVHQICLRDMWDILYEGSFFNSWRNIIEIGYTYDEQLIESTWQRCKTIALTSGHGCYVSSTPMYGICCK